MFTLKNITVAVVTVLISFGFLFFGGALSDRIGGGEEENSPFNAVMPDAAEFTPVETEGLDETVTQVYSSDTGGYVFNLDATGYYPHMMILCGVDADGVITGAVCTESSESLGKENTYGESFTGVTAESVDDVPVITGATKTTKGYKKAIKVALEAFEILKGR